MLAIAALESRNGGRTTVAYDGGSLEPHARAGEVDAYIVATEDGFSPLGMNLPFLSEDLGIPVAEFKRLADWNRFENPRVSLVALASRRRESFLRGVILAASETSKCYEKFAAPRYGRPYRDFYYNVTYEAISHSVSQWSARHLAISHLSASGRFHEDIATCNAEALAHYCDGHTNVVESFAFLGCCIASQHLSGISRLNAECQISAHRDIATEVVDRDGHVLIHLKWGCDA
jgi:hypothetical protein